jgi:hypothetical protein
VQLVHASQAKNLPGRPKTDLDAMWLARLTEMGLLRASFVPPKAIRDLRDYTRARTRLVHERTRVRQRRTSVPACGGCGVRAVFGLLLRSSRWHDPGRTGAADWRWGGQLMRGLL